MLLNHGRGSLAAVQLADIEAFEEKRCDSKIFRVLIGGGLPKHFSHFPEIWANFQKKFANSLKSSKIDITPVKTTEILRNSEKNRRKFDENLQNLPSLSKINKNCAEFCKNGAKVLKNHRNLEWCKGKNVDLVKSFPTSIYLQKSASIQPRTSLSKLGDLHLLEP